MARTHKNALVGAGAAISADVVFFEDHPDRRYRIRLPIDLEYVNEFRSLGPHSEDRRRIIVARVLDSLALRFGISLMTIPFLAFADEEIGDDDETLGLIFGEIMKKAGADLGVIGEGVW